jgi:hypothetical protein
VLGLTAYLDDSGSDRDSAVVTIGGPVFSRIQFREFSKKWAVLLDKFRIPQPLHMKDFVRPHGKHIGIGEEMKVALFANLCKLINSHKLYSLSISIPQQAFAARLAPDVQKNLIGPYAFAFFTAVTFVAELSKRRDTGGRISYVVDDGAAHKDQLVTAHSIVFDIEKQSRNMGRSPSGPGVGALGFDIDDNVPALQAADLIAWSARRRELGKLEGVFQPLHEVLNDKKAPTHGHVPVSSNGMDMLAIPINNWITKRGLIPSLKDIIRP